MASIKNISANVVYQTSNKLLIFFKRGFYCSGVCSYTEGAEGGTLDWAVNKVGGKDKELEDKNTTNYQNQ